MLHSWYWAYNILHADHKADSSSTSSAATPPSSPSQIDKIHGANKKEAVATRNDIYQFTEHVIILYIELYNLKYHDNRITILWEIIYFMDQAIYFITSRFCITI